MMIYICITGVVYIGVHMVMKGVYRVYEGCIKGVWRVYDGFTL